MSGSNNADLRNGERATGADSGGVKGTQVGTKDKGSGGSGGPSGPSDVGRALRSVYDDTLREDIPADIKDLLGRLG